MGETVTVGAIALVLLSLIGWVVQRMVSAALTNMKANTAAISACAESIKETTEDLKRDRAVRDERDKSFFKQLDRIEEKVSRR